MAKKYLSVDLDFWNNYEPETALRDLTRLFSLARKKKIPIVAVMNHQQLTKHVDRSSARELVNLDTHSDLSSVSDTDEFNCGTWVSFVRWRHRGTYRWLHRLPVYDGECSWQKPIFMDNHLSVRTRPQFTDWKRIARRRVRCMPNVSELLRDCVEVGFVLSPAFSDEGFEEVFRLMVEKFNIPYTKGVRNEHDFCAIRKPPHRKRK